MIDHAEVNIKVWPSRILKTATITVIIAATKPMKEPEKINHSFLVPFLSFSKRS